jgi:hypothetical protein
MKCSIESMVAIVAIASWSGRGMCVYIYMTDNLGALVCKTFLLSNLSERKKIEAREKQILAMLA